MTQLNTGKNTEALGSIPNNYCWRSPHFPRTPIGTVGYRPSWGPGDFRANSQYASELPICAALATRQAHFGPRDLVRVSAPDVSPSKRRRDDMQDHQAGEKPWIGLALGHSLSVARDLSQCAGTEAIIDLLRVWSSMANLKAGPGRTSSERQCLLILF